VVAATWPDRGCVGQVDRDISGAAPLSGREHAAGMLDDAVISSLTPGRVVRCAGPRFDGSVTLHELTPTSMFLSLCSVSSMAGLAGASCPAQLRGAKLVPHGNVFALASALDWLPRDVLCAGAMGSASAMNRCAGRRDRAGSAGTAS